MKTWQFNVMFAVSVVGVVFLLLAPYVGLDKAPNPTALTGFGAILTYVLTQKGNWTKNSNSESKSKDEEPEAKEGGSHARR